ncbi:MAG: glucokinase, partial [Acidobacteriota bacterium]
MSRSVRRVLAVDLGATHGRLAVFESDGGRLDRRSVEVHRLDDWASFDALIDSWWSKSRKLPALEAASVAVAGPIAVDSTAGQRARLTNRSWTVDVETLRDRLAVERVGLLNDIEALALGVLDLGADGLDTVHAGVERSGHLALLVPGTGLGQACLVWDGDRYWPMASEGGHVGFAPFDAESAALHARLSAAR